MLDTILPALIAHDCWKILIVDLIYYRQTCMYVVHDNCMMFIRVADLLKQQQLTQYFRSFQAMSEVISIQPRILFCILILIVTEHFLRGRDNIIDIELLFLATHEVLWSANTPIDVASVGAFDVVICVFALGHDPILAYAALTSFQFVVQVDCSHEASTILAVVVIGPWTIWKSPILTTHFCYLVHFITATAFALKRN